MTWKEILSVERGLHPGMNGTDALKLFHQALRGGDHLLRDMEKYREGVSREWDDLPPSPFPMPPLIQIINPSGSVARLHLVPAKARGIPFESVLDFLLSGGLCRTPEHRVEQALPGFLEAASSMGLPGVSPGTGSRGIPHHSPGYGYAAYRVIRL